MSCKAFVESLGEEQRKQLRELVPKHGAQLGHELLVELDAADVAGELEEAERMKLPRRGTNHTHPARPGSPCSVCGV